MERVMIYTLILLSLFVLILGVKMGQALIYHRPTPDDCLEVLSEIEWKYLEEIYASLEKKFHKKVSRSYTIASLTDLTLKKRIMHFKEPTTEKGVGTFNKHKYKKINESKEDLRLECYPTSANAHAIA